MISKIFESYEELKLNQKQIKKDLVSVKGLLEKLVGSDKRLSALAESEFKLPLENEEAVNEVDILLQDPVKLANLV